MMATMCNSIAMVQNQLSNIDNRLATLEALFFTSLSTVDPVSGTMDNSFASASSMGAESVDMSAMSACPGTPFAQTTAGSPFGSSVSPLVASLPEPKADKIRTIQKKASSRNSFMRGCMDVVFTEDEMGNSNVAGNRDKRKLDESKVKLVKRKGVYDFYL